LSGSGTAALEATLLHAADPGDEVAVVVTGAFGDRFARIGERFGLLIHRLEIPWGQACDPETLKSFLAKHPRIQAVFLTHCETSTGVLNPIRELARTVREHSGALTVVDAVSSLGATEFRMDEWGIDFVAAGSQKAWMLPPGLAFIAVGPRALKRMEKASAPRFYFNLAAYHASLEDGTTPYTPPLSHLFGLAEVLNRLEEEGMDQVFERHELLKRMTRAGVKALGLELLVQDRNASPTVTAVRGGEAFPDVEQLRRELKRLRIVVAGGQQQLRGKVFRIGHMGFCDPYDILSVLAALETALRRLGIPVSPGEGLKAAQEVWMNHV
jgi:aspartate aminotransferase-like enzyme